MTRISVMSQSARLPARDTSYYLCVLVRIVVRCWEDDGIVSRSECAVAMGLRYLARRACESSVKARLVAERRSSLGVMIVADLGCRALCCVMVRKDT